MVQFKNIFKATLIKPKNGDNHYLGIIVDSLFINSSPIYNQLMDFIHDYEDSNISHYFVNRANRNYNHKFHITILPFLNKDTNPMFLIECLTTEINDLELLGIGEVTQEEEQTFFIPVKSKTLSDIAAKHGIILGDLHITIAFKNKDIHGVDKSKANLLTFK